MTIAQQLLRSSLAAFIAIACFGCNNNAPATAATTDTLKKDTAKVDSAKPAAVAAPAAPVVPFDVAEVNETLKDYKTWKPGYDTTVAVRKAAGLDLIALSQVIDKPNMVQAVYKITDPKQVTDFFAKPEVKAIIAKAGVIGKPDVVLLHVTRFNPNSKEKQWVEITHKVKNFDAWLKVYDGEGTAKRLEEGMIDVAMARGTLDSNMVHLVFDIKDMAKAKAAIESADKKKLMMSAGVIGVPKIVFFTRPNKRYKFKLNNSSHAHAWLFFYSTYFCITIKRMLTGNQFTALALSFQGAVQKPHFERTGFAVTGKRMFATYLAAANTANIFLRPKSKLFFVKWTASTFIPYPINGAGKALPL